MRSSARGSATAGIALLGLLCALPLRALPRGPERRAEYPVGTRTLAYDSVQYGVASWYGPGFLWHRTASGARFDPGQLTAAHRTLPLGTCVKVTNLRNGRSVVVKVTDRGPWVRGRLIDLSRAAAERLGFKHRGVAPVRVAVIHKPDLTSRPSRQARLTAAWERSHPGASAQ
ncbi:MAG TPA: septal ring lytic transglycosylase RlpA family protein [Terriglobia bacterium]|nr:septal ring lytic transglycosylase RlpA family protein [Terriglobia bacterium]